MQAETPSTQSTASAGLSGAPSGDRILFVTRKWPPAVGGMETYALKLSRALARRADVETIALPGAADGRPPGVARLLVFGLRTGFRLLAEARPAPIVHVADMASWPLALCARLRAPGRRIVLAAHGTDVGYARRRGVLGQLYRAYLRLGARLLRSATVVANSGATAAAVREAGFPAPATVALATDLKGAPSTGHHAGTLLFAGRLVPRKGCSWFVSNVLPHLPEDICLEVAGTVWDAREGAALEHPRVRYLGPLGETALVEAYRRALAVVVPNVATTTPSFEGFGLAATEAAAAGGVVLAANRDGLREAVIDGETGFLLASGDPGVWRQKILEIRDWTPAHRAAFLERATTTCRRVYSWDRVAEDMLAIYAREPAP